jgi:hypothetical protein
MIAETLLPLTESEEVTSKKGTSVSMIAESLLPITESVEVMGVLIAELAESLQLRTVLMIEESLPQQSKVKKRKAGNQSRMVTRSKKIIDMDTLPSQP